MAARNGDEHTHSHFHIGLIVMLFLIGVVLLKHFYARTMWGNYIVQWRTSFDKTKSLDSVEDAGLIGATVLNVPTSATPLFKQPAELESYVQALSRQTGRDIVILSRDKKILADTVSSNVGAKYSFDKNDEITKTLGDGIARDFLETSVDYPSGITETVIAMKDVHGTIVGAILLSPSHIFR